MGGVKAAPFCHVEVGGSERNGKEALPSPIAETGEKRQAAARLVGGPLGLLMLLVGVEEGGMEWCCCWRHKEEAGLQLALHTRTLELLGSRSYW